MILLKTDENDPLIHVHKGFAKLAGDYPYIKNRRNFLKKI